MKYLPIYPLETHASCSRQAERQYCSRYQACYTGQGHSRSQCKLRPRTFSHLSCGAPIRVRVTIRVMVRVTNGVELVSSLCTVHLGSIMVSRKVIYAQYQKRMIIPLQQSTRKNVTTLAKKSHSHLVLLP